MKINEITNFLLKQYPLNLQEEWDESGYLNKGNLKQEVKKIFVCLDLSHKVVDEAIKQNVNLIVSHHPIFTKKQEDILWLNKKLILKIKKAGITVLSLHTCFDNSDYGMNFLVAEKLHLNKIGWYKRSQFVTGYFPKQLTVKQIASLFRKTFHVSLLTTNANANEKFNKLAICAGSGLSVFTTKFDELANQDILLVTGDIKHHGWQDLTAYQLKALDVGHDLENCFCDYIANFIKDKFKEITIVSITTSKKEKSI